MKLDPNQAVQVALIPKAVGCNKCKPSMIPVITTDTTWGLNIQVCNLKQDYDFTKEGVPCSNLGYVQVLKGYVETEKTLVCTKCSTLIPNCDACSSLTKCDLCASGFTQVDVYDDKGVLKAVCLK